MGVSDGAPPGNDRAALLAPVGRWTAGAKARLIGGILDGVITVQEATAAHRLSAEELLDLARMFGRGGQNALRMKPAPDREGEKPWPFEGLKPFSYDLIMIDPPWPTKMRSVNGEKKSAASKYALMSFEDIAALPVGDLASEHCVLFVWATFNILLYGGDPDRRYADADPSRSRVGECIKAWGARFVSGGAWHKKMASGVTAFGTGYRVRSSCEPFLLAMYGNPRTSRGERNIIEGVRREHSRKPEDAYAWCERYLPNARRLELFSRSSRPGWDSWGNEAGKFDAAPGAAA